MSLRFTLCGGGDDCCGCCCGCCEDLCWAPNILERSLLWNCSFRGSLAVFRLYLRLPCVNVNCQHLITGDTPLFLASEANSFPKVMLLLRRGADPQMPNRSGMTPLRLALNRRHHDLVYYMCQDTTLDIDAQHLGVGGTALHQACLENNAGGVNILLSSGANPDLLFLDHRGRRRNMACLDIAVMKNNPVIVHQLLLFNCNTTLHTLESAVPAGDVDRVWRVLNESTEIAAMLVEAGCPLSSYCRHHQVTLPRESPLRRVLMEIPSLRSTCRAVVRASLNSRQEWRKGYSVSDQVFKVVNHYKRHDLLLRLSKVAVTTYLLMADLGVQEQGGRD